MKNNVLGEKEYVMSEVVMRKIIEDGAVDKLDDLLKSGCDLLAMEKDGYTLLEQACIWGNLEIVKWLYQSEIKFKKERYELSYAASENKMDILCYLLSAGANASGVDETGRNGLHWAAQEDYRDVCALLLKNKCCVNQMESSGQTPLYIAAAENNYVIAEMLLTSNALTELCRVFDGTTPFMIACKFGNFLICDLLLSYGANVDTRDSEGRTALFYANVCCAKEQIQYLISKGADISIKDGNGISPQDICENAGLRKTLYQELYVD